VKVKICGITNLGDAQLAVNCGTDALGFIFYERSKRYIAPEKAKEIIASLPFFVVKVGVFVNERVEKVNKIAKDIGLNAVQLHGNETIVYCKQITHPIIKAFRVDEDFDFYIIDQYSDYQIMLDTYSSKEHGGTGATFNWETIPAQLKKEIILAGGISENNIEEIYANVKPQAVDLSSSLEIEPGKKDHNKVKTFLNKLNNLRKHTNGNCNGH